MKFSTEIQAQIRPSLVKGLGQYFTKQMDVIVLEIETTLRQLLVELGGQAVYQFPRETKVKNLFAWASYRRQA